MNRPMTKKEWFSYLEQTWDAAQKEAWSEQPRQWVGLTDDEIRALASWWPSYDQMPALIVLAKDIQENLKERNHR